MKRFFLLTLAFVALTSTGCRLFQRDCDSRDRRDYRDSNCSRDRDVSRSNAANCDTVGTSYGQPLMQGAVVGSLPGYTSAPISGPITGDSDLPYPQPTIPSPGVPSTAPIASIPSPSFVQKPR